MGGRGWADKLGGGRERKMHRWKIDGNDNVLITTETEQNRLMMVVGKIHNDKKLGSGLPKVGATMSWGTSMAQGSKYRIGWS